MTCEAHGTRPCLCISLHRRLFLPRKGGNRSPHFDSGRQRERDPAAQSLSWFMFLLCRCHALWLEMAAMQGFRLSGFFLFSAGLSQRLPARRAGFSGILSNGFFLFRQGDDAMLPVLLSRQHDGRPFQLAATQQTGGPLSRVPFFRRGGAFIANSLSAHLHKGQAELRQNVQPCHRAGRRASGDPARRLPPGHGTAAR